MQKATLNHYDTFVNSLNRSPSTRRKYVTEFNYYLEWLGIKDPDILIKASITTAEETRDIEDKIIEYMKYMSDTCKLSYSSINVKLCAIFHFYTINRVNIDRKYIAKFKPMKILVRKVDNAYTHEQILCLLDSSADLRLKVTILLMASTDMRIGALPGLTVGSLSKIELDNYHSHLYKIMVYRGDPEQYYTFCTFECASVIDQYLSYRQRSGEILTINSPLIREQFNSKDMFLAKRPKFLDLEAFNGMIDRLLLVTGIKNRTRKEERKLHPVMRSHGFRKFAITQMIKAKLDFSTREFLVGHRCSRGLDVNYDRTSEEDRLQEYLKAIDLLTISTENRLRKEIQDKDQIINYKLQEKDDALVTLSDQVMKLMEEVRELKKQSRSLKT